MPTEVSSVCAAVRVISARRQTIRQGLLPQVPLLLLLFPRFRVGTKHRKILIQLLEKDRFSVRRDRLIQNHLKR